MKSNKLYHGRSEAVKRDATPAPARTPQYKIGLTFNSYRNKHPRPETIVDILTTRNEAGEVVKIRYATEHEFMGQIVSRNDVLGVEIARSI
jgi:hypothetical protein